MGSQNFGTQFTNKNSLLNIKEEEGGSGSPPTIHLRTDDVRDNIHSHLCHAKCPMMVGGGGGGEQWPFPMDEV